MNKVYKDEWIKALRSGDYIQGKEALRIDLDGSEPSYCCLGVLAEIYVCDEWPRGRLKSENEFLSAEASELFGLEPETQEFLAGLNDNAGNSFSEIADYIEEIL